MAVMVLIVRRNLSSEDMIQKIASVDGIAGYDASLIALCRIFYDEEGKNLALAQTDYSLLYLWLHIILNITSLFLSGRFELVEGSHITEDMTDGIIHQPGTALNGTG